MPCARGHGVSAIWHSRNAVIRAVTEVIMRRVAALLSLLVSADGFAITALPQRHGPKLSHTHAIATHILAKSDGSKRSDGRQDVQGGSDCFGPPSERFGGLNV